MSKYYFIPVLQPSRHGSQQKRGSRTLTAARGGRERSPHLTNVTFAAPKVSAPCVWLGPAQPPASTSVLNGLGAPRAKGQSGKKCSLLRIHPPNVPAQTIQTLLSLMAF